MVMILTGLGILVVLLLGLVGWWLANVLAGGSSDGGISDGALGLTTSATAPEEPGAPTAPTGVPVPATDVQVISPQGTPDDPTGAPYVLDDDPSTMWQTDVYFQQFPSLKNGVGLLATLPAPTNLTQVWINSPSPGTRGGNPDRTERLPDTGSDPGDRHRHPRGRAHPDPGAIHRPDHLRADLDHPTRRWRDTEPDHDRGRRIYRGALSRVCSGLHQAGSVEFGLASGLEITFTCA